MAANNYFGFTHSGTQYAPTGATPYQAAQTGYAVAPTPAAATYTQRAAPAYDTAYQAAAATHTTPGTYAAVPAGTTTATPTYDYTGYAARSAQTAYDTTKTYYQQQAPAAATYSTTDYPGWQSTTSGNNYEYTTATGKAQYSASYSTQANRNTTQVPTQKATSYSTGAAYASQQAQPASNYTSASYSTPPIAQQPQPTQNKVMATPLHRNLSTVAEYTQPAQQRPTQAFTPKVKKTFHPAGANVTASSIVGPAAPGTTSNVTPVTSYPTVTTQQQQQAPQQQTYSAASTVPSTNSYAQNYTPATNPQAQTAAAAAKPKTATTYSGYDAALYSAATMYVAQQTTPAHAGNTSTVKTTSGWQNYKKPMGMGVMKSARQKLPPKPQQLHYCDVCKISCAGPQTYREHLEGQKHKKKEASMKAGTTPAVPRGSNALRCELCDVTCTGSDAYAAHIRGAKHQKVVKLHTKLGKPIPSTDPKALQAAGAASTTGKANETVVASPKINFVASGNLGTVKTGAAAAGTTTANSNGTVPPGTSPPRQASPTVKEEKVEDVEMTTGNDNIAPVGVEYIEEILNDEGKVISFNCKLCECRFNDPNAKGMHMKGRRHRLQFKKKVNPDLVVDIKTSMRQRKMQEEKMRRQAMREEYFRRREEERASFWTDRMMEVEERIYWEERRRYEEELEYYEWYRRHAGPRAMGPPPPPPPYGPPVGPPMMPPPPPPPPNHPGRSQPFFPAGPPMPPQGIVRRPDTSDDRHVIARHASIYPKESELQAVQKIVSHTEKALKLVSDHLTDAGKTTGPTTAPGKPGPQAGGPNKSGPQAGGPNKPGPQAGGPNKPGPQAGGPNKPGAGPQAKSQPARPTPPATPLAFIKKEGGGKEPLGNMRKEDGRAGNLFSFQREKEDSNAGRMLKGVMRVGVLAKGLLLAGDTATDLVMLCAEKPTRSLLAKVAANLPAQLKTVAPDENYSVVGKPDAAAIVVSNTNEPKMSVTVTLTSPVIREQLIQAATGEGGGDGAQATSAAVVKDPPDVLNKAKCLEALAALRHAKWFQARVTGLQSCVMVIRILRDLCHRNPTWAPLNPWAMELLAEKVLSSAGAPMPPGDGLRRIMEALASGILLGPGPGLLDPCEKEQTDATAGLTPQQREDITASAQHALRLMAFRQIHKVLGMEVLPTPKYNRSSHHRFARKRRRDNSSGEGNDSEAGDGKKDKKDEGGVTIKMETDKK